MMLLFFPQVSTLLLTRTVSCVYLSISCAYDCDYSVKQLLYCAILQESDYRISSDELACLSSTCRCSILLSPSIACMHDQCWTLICVGKAFQTPYESSLMRSYKASLARWYLSKPREAGLVRERRKPFCEVEPPGAGLPRFYPSLNNPTFSSAAHTAGFVRPELIEPQESGSPRLQLRSAGQWL